jgi:hypothetical protein
MVGQSLPLVSIDFGTRDTLLNRLRSVAVKFQPESTQSVAEQPRGWASRATLVLLSLVVWPHVVYMSQTYL